MIDITHHSSRFRKAVAQAVIRCKDVETIRAIKTGQVPGGDVLEMARTAGLFAVKRTRDVLPGSYSLPIEFTDIRFGIEALSIHIEVEVHTIYKTGVEAEAMHAASVVALTIFDMVKSIDREIIIENIQLLRKDDKGKHPVRLVQEKSLCATVIICSDAIVSGKKEDRAGRVILEKLEALGVDVKNYLIIPDEKDHIQKLVLQKCGVDMNMIILAGGTGVTARDVTTEALQPLLHKRIPGIEEAIRSYGQKRTPYAMISRSVSGLIDNTLVLALPGSTRGAEESMEAIFPDVLHIFRILNFFGKD